MSSNVPPVPYREPIIDKFGIITPIWSDWFRSMYQRAGGNIAETNDELETVETTRIVDLAVTTPKIADLAVTTAKINDLAVTTGKLGDSAVTATKITDDTITFVKLLTTDWLKSTASTGYQKFGSGIILQWGSATSIASGATGSQLFATTFPTNCRHAFATITANSGALTTTTGQWGVGNLSTTGFDIYNRTSVAQTFSWMAVGY